MDKLLEHGKKLFGKQINRWRLLPTNTVLPEGCRSMAYIGNCGEIYHISETRVDTNFWWPPIQIHSVVLSVGY
jgi:hypothetical protein